MQGFFIIIFLVVLSGSNSQKTNAEVKNCMDGAHETCKSQCVNQISNQNFNAKIQNCISQDESKRAQMEATMKSCLSTHLPNFESMPCMTPPRNLDEMGGKFGPNQMGSIFVMPAILQTFHNCSQECIKTTMNPCFHGCTQTMPDASFMDSMMQCHLKVASQQGGSSGKNQFRPNEPNGPNGAPSDMLQCMMTAANGV